MVERLSLVQYHCQTTGGANRIVRSDQPDVMDRRRKSLVDWSALDSARHG